MRVNEFALPNNSQPVTISFDYNIVNPITSANQIRVGLRFFDSNNNFNGEHNTYIGTPNGDTGAQGWKHLSETYSVPAGSVNSDIRVSMNIFGDDIWNNGPVLFDNFVIITGTSVPLTAANVLMGTVTTTPVTRPTADASQVDGILEPDGILADSTVSYVTAPAHGTVTTYNTYGSRGNVTYVANSGFTGTDSFGFGIGDGLGGLATSTASVQVNSTIGLNKFGIAPNPNNNGSTALFSFTGAGQCDYILQTTPSLSTPLAWTPVMTNQASTGGSVTFTNQTSNPAAFYRTVLMP
jgi:hypothetical protein